MKYQINGQSIKSRKVQFASYVLLLFLAAFLIAGPALAHQPVLEGGTPAYEDMPQEISGYRVQLIKDPTFASQAVYGRLSSPTEIDVYAFKPGKTEITLDMLVPARPSNLNFAPTLAVLGPDIDGGGNGTLPIPVPEGYQALKLPATGERKPFFEPFSMEKLYYIQQCQLLVSSGSTYYLVVFEPSHYMGDYTIGLGTIENFSDTSIGSILKDVFLIKMGLADSGFIPWADILGLFIFMAGFVIGLGAVTVIDLHGLLGRKSPYWNEATIRTHKITKPLIWLGFVLAVSGALIIYRESGISGVATFQVFLAALLFLNGLFLSFWVSPRLLERERQGRSQELLPFSWQMKIALSFIISFIGWWVSLFLLAWYLMVTR